MHRERKLAALRDALGDEGYLKGDEAVFFCKNPKGCAGTHKKRKLSVNLKTDVFHCWVCGWGHRSSIEPILKLRPGSEFLAEYSAEHRDQPVIQEKIYEQVSLPKAYRSLSAAHRSPWFNQAMAYLGRRGLDASDALLYKLGFAEDGDYVNRIIVPSFDEHGELNFVVGRAIYDSAELKYKHGRYDKDIIFNDYLIDWSEPITLVEGPFDMMKAGPNAIPLLGVFIRPALLKKIVENRVPITIALDADAWPTTIGTASKLMRLGVETSIMTWPADEFKDPGDMPKGTIEQFRKNAIRIGNSVDILRAKAFHSAMMRS